MKRSTSFIAGSSALAAAILLPFSGVMPLRASAADTVMGGAGAATLSRGKDLYWRQGCYQCHGLVGQGSIFSGPKLSPLRLDSAAFGSYVRNPSGSMPPYTAEILPAADLAQIEAYVRSLPSPRAARTIPLLASITARSSLSAPTGGNSAPDAAGARAGSALYAQNCAACHGAQLEGGIGPDLRGEGKKRGVAGIVDVILAPPAGMPRLYPRPMSQSEVEAVAAFVHSGR